MHDASHMLCSIEMWTLPHLHSPLARAHIYECMLTPSMSQAEDPFVKSITDGRKSLVNAMFRWRGEVCDAGRDDALAHYIALSGLCEVADSAGHQLRMSSILRCTDTLQHYFNLDVLVKIAAELGIDISKRDAEDDPPAEYVDDGLIYRHMLSRGLCAASRHLPTVKEMKDVADALGIKPELALQRMRTMRMRYLKHRRLKSKTNPARQQPSESRCKLVSEIVKKHRTEMVEVRFLSLYHFSFALLLTRNTENC